ncbi:MAG: biopolymer transporter ExbD [Gammaproteobacteria bacterium]|nr:biopolymer transporter ExbD [Gammaproteobacteria bacterium]
MKMSRRAKRMQRNHRRNKGHAVINIISMIDMLTVLVLFLLVNSGNMQNLPSNKAVRLPESSATQLPGETVIVSISNQDIVAQGRKVAEVGDVLASDDEIVPALLEELEYQARNSAKLSGSGAPGEITIMGDKQIPYALLKKIMKTCAMANYTNISLAVIHKAAKG